MANARWQSMAETIRQKLREANINVVRVDSRIKRMYSIYQKMIKQKITADQMYDLHGAADHHQLGE